MKSSPFTNTIFKDKRIAKRANAVLAKMTSCGSSVINRFFNNFAEKTASYRMFNNSKVTKEAIVQSYAAACSEHIREDAGRHVLCIQDTCEINFEGHNLRMRKKGKVPGCVSNEEAGCFLHPTIAIDAESLVPYGFTHIRMWSRNEGSPGCRERKYKQLPPEGKESFRWSESIEKTVAALGTSVRVTMLSDRESDVFDVLRRGNSNGNTVRLIVRSNQNRRLYDSDIKLHDFMRSLAPDGTYDLPLPPSHGRKGRTAKMEIRYARVCIAAPADTHQKYGEGLCYNCIRVSETEDSVPEGEKPIEWVLLTNHDVTSVADAMQCVEWYKCRWYIEELFRILKRKGFMIEDIQLEKTECIEKNILFAVYSALLTITLKHAFDRPELYVDTAATKLFDTDEIEAARLISPSVNGKTAKQQNPYKDGTLPWLSWIIARLGSWSAYLSQSRPGYITFKAGLDRFKERCEMFRLVKDVYKG